jgi:hypothetical protein
LELGRQRGSRSDAVSGFRGNQNAVFLQNSTNINITGTSIKTPTTVAKAAPEFKPKKHDSRSNRYLKMIAGTNQRGRC